MRIVSGIRPSGALHIGNYLGAIKQFIALQEEHECFFFIADLHGLTDNPDPEDLRQRVQQTTTDYLALGLDPQKATLFIQSQIPAHTEATWLLATLTPVGELSRMTQYKEKSAEAKQRDLINAGLLFYPVLMAADILLYRPQGVPIGEDQKQHLELTRNIAQRFNQRYGTLFPVPEPLIPKAGARVMSLADPKKKMSKSHGEDTVLGIFDDPDTIRKKIAGAVTDSGKTVSYDPKKKPALANLIELYALFAEEPPQRVAERFHGSGYADFKAGLADLLIEKLAPFRERRKQLAQSSAHVREILRQGTKRAEGVATDTLREMRQKMGLR